MSEFKPYPGPINWFDFAAKAATRRAGNQVPGADSVSQRSENSSDVPTGWSGVSFEKACEMAIHGWPEGAEKISRQLDSLAPSEETAPDWSLETAGAFPCIPAFLSGEPECIWRMTEGRRAERRITLIIPVCFNAGVSAKHAEQYAIACTAVVRALEGSGMIPAIYGLSLHSNGFAYCVAIREHGEPLDLSKVAFSMHPSFLRRLQFAWCELTPEAYAAGAATFGYGHVARWLPENIDPALPDCGHRAIAPHISDIPAKLFEVDQLPALIEYIRAAVDKSIKAATA